MSEVKIITRPYDSIRFQRGTVSGSESPVELKPQRKKVFEKILDPNADFDEVWKKYSGSTSAPVYAHFIVPTPQEPGPSLQLFTSDIFLGNRRTEGICRLLIDPTRENPRKKARKSFRELRRYSQAGIIYLKGFFVAKEVES